MHNYFNTPSSFGFTTQSSYNAEPVSARSNISHLSGINLSTSHPHHGSHELDEDDEIAHEGEPRHHEIDGFRIEDVYLGLTNIKKDKTLIILSLIWEAKQKYYKSLAFYRISSFSPSDNSVKYRKIYLLLLRYSKYQPKFAKNQAFTKLKQNMNSSRTRQLKIQSVFGQIMNRRQEFMRNIFKIWKSLSEDEKLGLFTEGRDGKKLYRPLNKLIITNIKLGFKLLKIFRIQKIYLSFNKIKYFSSKPKINEPLAFKKTSSAGTYKSMLNNLPISIGSYSYSKKMSKIPNKIAQGKIQQKRYGKQVYNMMAVINQIILKRKKFFIQSAKGYLQSAQSADETDRDDCNITTNILKHICWLSSRQAMKQSLKIKNISEQLTKRKARVLTLGLKRKQKNQMKTALDMWRKQSLTQRIQVMKRVKQLQNLKQMYIENYK